MSSLTGASIIPRPFNDSLTERDWYIFPLLTGYLARSTTGRASDGSSLKFSLGL